MQNYSCAEENEYTWFYRSRYYGGSCTSRSQITYDHDKVGITSDGKFMIHDHVLYRITPYKKFEKKERYNFGGIVGPQDATVLYLVYEIIYEPNFILHEKDTTMHFKFLKRDGKYEFLYLGFNNKEFRQRPDDE